MPMSDRAVSTVVGYAIMLGIIGLLTSGVIMGAANYVDSQRTDVTRTELSVVGNQLAADLTAADTLAGVPGTDTVEVESELVTFVAGGTYRIDITEGDDDSEYRIVLTSNPTRVSKAVTVVTDHDVETGSVNGGDLTITMTGDTLEVTND